MGDSVSAHVSAVEKLISDVAACGSQIASCVQGVKSEFTAPPPPPPAAPADAAQLKLAQCRLQQVERLQALGVSEVALRNLLESGAEAAESPLNFRWLGQPPASRLRVMQWNVLAEGLADDGFLVEDVLAESDGEDTLASGATLLAASEPLKALEASIADPVQARRAERNLTAVIDWEARYARLLSVVQMVQPDVLTLQELDHMADAKRDLGDLGYACSLGDLPYRPMHASGLPATDAAGYLRALREGKVAFAPKFPSKCRTLALKSGVSDPDDMGVAVFWRRDRLEATAIDFLPLASSVSPPANQEAAIKVQLRRREDGARVCVLCAHLGSGDKPKDEAERVVQVDGGGATAGLRDALVASADEVGGSAAILCMDANSAPTRAEAATVWKSLRQTPRVRSVWDAHFMPGGARVQTKQGSPRSLLSTTSAEPAPPFPVTTNKMRGPLSKQKNKVGEHMLHVIDHIFFMGEALRRPQHVCGPVLVPTAAAAHAHLLPSLQCPSDHFPVVVEFEVQPSSAQ